jgi:hypothetical protein
MDLNKFKPKYYKDPRSNEVAGIMYRPNGFTISIPLDPNNRHYQEILEWAKIDGNTIEEAD